MQASLMSSSSLKSEEMFIEEYVQLTGEKIVDLECNIIELVERHGIEKPIWI
jgi:hypothetical protein